MIAIEVTGIGAVRRGSREVPVPDLAVRGPGLVRVQGANGSGKSTLIELLAGGIAVAHGTVRVCGAPATSTAARRLRRVCRAESALLDHVPLGRQASLFARACGVPAREALAALDDAGLMGRLGDAVEELSTGEARRAWVQLTTLGYAPVLLLDEPFLGIDASWAAAMRDRIARWATDRLVVLVDHAGTDAPATTEIALARTGIES